jgi:concanavalin A-like lectin/glucanase superfamily protein
MARQLPGSTDKITSTLTANNAQRSYSIWTYRIGDGASNLGRIWHKGGSAAQLDTSHNNNATDNAYDYNRRFSVSNGIWRYPRPPANEWHHIAIAHDMSSDANDPSIWLDGFLQSPTEAQTPSGTVADNNTLPYCFGNRDDDGSRGWDGRLAEIAIWNRLLTASEALGLANGNTPMRYVGLISYLSLRHESLTDFFQAAATATGTTVAQDPPFARVKIQRSLRPNIFAPGIAR